MAGGLFSLTKIRDLTKGQRYLSFDISPMIEIKNWETKMSNRNIYLEVGALNLNKIDHFLQTHNKDEWMFHLFEPNPIPIVNIKREMEERDLPNIKLWEVAAGVAGGRVVFYPGHRSVGHAGGTLLKGKYKYVDYDHPIEVDCIDFNQWIKDNIREDDNVYMNMDIEGAEYQVLPKMIEDGSIDLISMAEIELHSGKFNESNRVELSKIHGELKQFFLQDKFKDFLLYRL